MSIISKYENLQVVGGSDVYLEDEATSRYIDEVELIETVRKVVRIHSSQPFSHDEAMQIVEDLYEKEELIVNGDDEVYDVKIQ